MSLLFRRSMSRVSPGVAFIGGSAARKQRVLGEVAQGACPGTGGLAAERTEDGVPQATAAEHALAHMDHTVLHDRSASHPLRGSRFPMVRLDGEPRSASRHRRFPHPTPLNPFASARSSRSEAFHHLACFIGYAEYEPPGTRVADRRPTTARGFCKLARFTLGLSTRKMGTGSRPRTLARESPTVAGREPVPIFLRWVRCKMFTAVVRRPTPSSYQITDMSQSRCRDRLWPGGAPADTCQPAAFHGCTQVPCHQKRLAPPEDGASPLRSGCHEAVGLAPSRLADSASRRIRSDRSIRRRAGDRASPASTSIR
jgi:hypothetical protein